jgi:hypothetical protein
MTKPILYRGAYRTNTGVIFFNGTHANRKDAQVWQQIMSKFSFASELAVFELQDRQYEARMELYKENGLIADKIKASDRDLEEAYRAHLIVKSAIAEPPAGGWFPFYHRMVTIVKAVELVYPPSKQTIDETPEIHLHLKLDLRGNPIDVTAVYAADLDETEDITDLLYDMIQRAFKQGADNRVPLLDQDGSKILNGTKPTVFTYVRGIARVFWKELSLLTTCVAGVAVYLSK